MSEHDKRPPTDPDSPEETTGAEEPTPAAEGVTPNGAGVPEDEVQNDASEAAAAGADDEPQGEPEDEHGEEGDTGEEEDLAPGEMTLSEHLLELRSCLVRSFIALMVGFVGCYPFSKDLFGILMEPMTRVLDESSFIYTYPPEAFFTYLKVSLVGGFFAASPYIFYQVWRFVAPGLYEQERKWLIPIAVVSAACFTAGALFGYFVVFPFGFEFFASFATEDIVFTPKLSEYLGFSLKLLFAFGFVFELPLFIFFLARLGLVTAQGLRRKQKYAIILSFVASAILTPPDVFTQTLMAGPLILLYEVGIWVAHLFGKKRPEPESEDDAEDEDDAETA